MIRKGLARWHRSLRRRSRAQLMKAVYATLFALALLIAGVSGYRLIVYVYSSPRLEVRKVTVAGADRVSDSAILARSGYVPGVNTLDLDLDRMRESVEQIPGVRNASVQRVWPNEIVISVVERTPVGLARIDGQIFQVDAEGVVLPPDASAGADFPILDGIVAGDTAPNAIKIDLYRKIVDEIGDRQLSEVHVNGRGEVSVVPSDDPVLVDLGSVDQLARWQKFLGLRDRIREDYPGTSRIDLRFRDQVKLETREAQPPGRIVWGEEEGL